MSIPYFRGLVCSLFLCIVCSASAQFNIKIGYTGNYMSLEKTADIFDRYSAQFNENGKVLKQPRFLNGIELGARYVFGNHIGIDMGISSVRGDSDVKNVSIAAGDSFSTEWKTSLSNIYIGLENYFGWFGYGANIGYQQIKYRNKTSINTENIEILKQNALSSRFYIMLESVSNNTSFSLRPFVSVNWEPYNLQALELELLPDSSSPASSFDEDMMVFGISLIIYNGPGRN